MIFYYRDSLAFATESCFGSLANCLGFYDNIALPIPKEFDDYKLFDVEIRYGVLQVSHYSFELKKLVFVFFSIDL